MVYDVFQDVILLRYHGRSNPCMQKMQIFAGKDSSETQNKQITVLRGVIFPFNKKIQNVILGLRATGAEAHHKYLK